MTFEGWGEGGYENLPCVRIFSQTSGDRIFSPDAHRCRIFFQTYTPLKIFFQFRNYFPPKSVCRTFFFAEITHIACVQTSPLPEIKIGRRNSVLPIFFLGRGDICTQGITHTVVPPQLKVKWSVTCKGFVMRSFPTLGWLIV